MTTKVKIINEGPKTVKVEVQGRDAHGHFTQVAENTLEVGRYADVYVYKGQSLQVLEVDED